jgi:hypothetical protein
VDPHHRLDRGAGLVTTMLGVPVVLLLTLFGTQVLLRLHATSTVRSLAGDAVREVAIDPATAPAAAEQAGQVLRERLGAAGATADLDWALSEAAVTLRVRVEPPRVLPLAGLGHLDGPIVASASARRERWA